MAPKRKHKDCSRRSETPGQTSASDPNPTATSPFASSPTGDATTTFLFSSSVSASAPPTTTQLIPSAPPQTTSLLPSSISPITTTQPLPSAPPLRIQETDQERISCTSDGATPTNVASPSSAPSASASSTTTPTLLPTTDEFKEIFDAAVGGATEAMQSLKVEDRAKLQEIIVGLLGKVRAMESVLDSLLGLAEQVKGDAQLKEALETVFNMELLKSVFEVTETVLVERNKRQGIGGSCGGSKGEGGGSDSGTGEGDGEGGGLGV